MKRATSDKANSYFLSGHEVLFPLDRTPFPSQKVMMSMMLNCLQKRKNGLLESPTGTGKTLAVLTASLAYQKQDYAIAEATFNEEMTKYQEELKVLGLDKTVNAAVHIKLPQKAKKKKIIFASRTHSQLQQSVKELDIIRDEYTQGLIVGLLGSRKQFCVNETVLMNRQNLDEQCLELKKVRGCKYNYYLDPLVKYMHANPVLDIEDIQSKGLKYKSCPYYASKKIAMYADLLFVPYNYVLDPAIRKSSIIDLKDSIIIFDEAHNIEDVCRDVASCEMEFTSLEIAKKQLSKLSEHGSTAFGVFLKLISELKDWCDEMHRLLLGSVVGDSGDGIWTGSEILEIYKDRFGLSVDTLAIYESSLNTISEEQEDAAGIVNDTTDPMMQPYSDHIDLAYENEDNNENMNPSLAMNKNPHVLSAPILMMLKNLVLIFKFMLCDDAKYADDYRIVIEKKYNPNERSPSLTLKFWCLSSHLPFQELKANCHSIILTSGTLSPLDSFEAQLGVPFEVKVENNHVIDVTRQVWCGAIARCNNVDMDGTYKNQSNLKYQDSLGTIIKIVSNVAPGGTLVFFTSYSTRDKLLERIESNGFLNDLQQNGVKVCIEPKDNNELKSVINNYKTAISSGRKAIMFCVFKGKISEGISFSDSYCRSVIMIGIPYGNTQDRRSSLKKEFQDIQSRNNPIHINGSKWYSQQAYRAINQAVGRVIRHRLDWGSILLVDQRYCHAEHYGQLSKWLRGNVQIVNNFEDGIIPLNLYYSSLISDETFNGKSDIDPITIEDEDEISKVTNSTITKSSLVLDASKVKNEVVVAKKAKKQTGQIRLTNYFISKKSD